MAAFLSLAGTAHAAPGDAPLATMGALPVGPSALPVPWAAPRSPALSLALPRAPLAGVKPPTGPSLKLDDVTPPEPHLRRPAVAPYTFSSSPLTSLPAYAWSPNGPLPLQWPAPAIALAPQPVTGSHVQKNVPERDKQHRSLWARWHSSLAGVTGTVGLFMVSMVGVFTLLPNDVTGWDNPKFSGMKRNVTEGPRFDNDRFFWNYIAHPLAGSEFYMMARNRGYSWWGSFIYSAAVSCTFEFIIESTYEQASWQDIFITPISGAAFGELRWQAKKSLEDPREGKPIGAWHKFLYVLVDPFEALLTL
jgi:hypothetical protein